jgi:Ca-activated chloride channel homolog
MSSRKVFRIPLMSLVLLSALSPTPIFAQDVQDESEEDYSNIVVTGSLRQGGAQDIQHFRTMAEMTNTLPRPESLTVEGLLGEHDLSLPAGATCAQILCLNLHAMTANLPTRPGDLLFVGLGFDSNVDAAGLKREPLSLMAVVDRSGSMDGAPIANVKAALHQIVDEMTPRDRLGITIYGDNSTVHLQPTDAANNKQRLHDAIDAIAIEGSTYMEEGLRIGYDAAFAEAKSFDGNVRMMLFTDEQPNVGNTSADGFMTMARDASKRGIGLTTIGVGVQYDGRLASQISSVRGGNLFFIDGPDKGRELMQKEFRNMVSEVAHDLVMTLAPRDGYRITGVFGVPDGMMRDGRDGAVTVTVPSAFLSSNGGGIYASLGKADGRAFLPAAATDDGAPLMDIGLTYVSAIDGRKRAEKLAVSAPTAAPPANLRLAQTLVDEYLVLDASSRAFHVDGDPRRAFALLDGLKGRLATVDYADLSDERGLVDTMHKKAALYAGYGSEAAPPMPTKAERQAMGVVGKWRVVALNGVDDLSRNDILEFTDSDELITYFKRPLKGEDEMYQDYEMGEGTIRIPDGDLEMRYRLDGNRLDLRTRDGQSRISLRREATS